MADVFISYHEKSAGDMAQQIADALENIGISCWYARRDMPPGGDFARNIPPQINECRLFLLLLNEDVYQSRHVENEVGLAFSRLNKGENILILPLEIGDFIRKGWIAYYLIHIQSVRYQGIGELLKNVSALLKPRPIEMASDDDVSEKRLAPLHQTTAPSPDETNEPSNIIKSGNCGDSATYALDKNGILNIRGTGNMQDYEYDADTRAVNTPWWNERKMISLLRIQSGITSIGKRAFFDLSSLKKAVIPDSVTDIGDWAFYQCKSLPKVSIPQGVMFLGDHAFAKCEALKRMIIPDSVEDMGNYTFSDCKNLSSVIIPNNMMEIGEGVFGSCFSLSNIALPNSLVSIGDLAFYECFRLRNIKIPENVLSIGNWAFADCEELSTLKIPESVNYLGTIPFAGCPSLTKITVDEKNSIYKDIQGVLFNKDMSELICYPAGKRNQTYRIPDGVINIENSAFADCDNLCNLQMPLSIANINERAFEDCANLKNIAIGDGVMDISDKAFSGCTRLRDIFIPDSVIHIGEGAFSNCAELTDIIVNKNHSEYCTVEGVLFDKDISQLICYPAGKENVDYTIPNSVTSIGFEAFCGCKKLEKVIIPDGLETIEIGAFEDCERLISVNFPNNILSIGYRAFKNCSSLTSVTIPDRTKDVGSNAFDGCKNLATASVPADLKVTFPENTNVIRRS